MREKRAFCSRIDDGFTSESISVLFGNKYTNFYSSVDVM